MYREKKFLCVIPARGGSKGIPRKNIVNVYGKPLIQYTIEAALASKYIDDIIVSTDDKEIAEVSICLGIDVPYLRPHHLATDDAKTIDTINHVIEEQKRLGKDYNYVIVLQPTQPLRKGWHVDEAIQKIVRNSLDSLVSVTKVTEHPILMRTIDENDFVKSLLDLNSTVRRQELPDVYKVNGSIYINKVSDLQSNTSLNDNKLSYIMDKKYDLDIDDDDDLLKLNHSLEQTRHE